jgi:hypothetical protein
MIMEEDEENNENSESERELLNRAKKVAQV